MEYNPHTPSISVLFTKNPIAKQKILKPLNNVMERNLCQRKIRYYAQTLIFVKYYLMY